MNAFDQERIDVYQVAIGFVVFSDDIALCGARKKNRERERVRERENSSPPFSSGGFLIPPALPVEVHSRALRFASSTSFSLVLTGENQSASRSMSLERSTGT